VMSDPANPLVGARQTFWDHRAAMNFTMGGMTSGLVVIAYLASLAGLLPGGALPLINAIAAAGMAVGLFFVFLEIGRKLRFLRVLMRPQSSWMTRETYFVAVFYPVVAADLIWPMAALHLLAALSAAGFLYSQARILQAGKGIPAWRHPQMPMMLVATGLFEGVGLLALIALIDPALFAVGNPLVAAGIVLALINAAMWRRYMTSATAEGIGPLARGVLTRLTPTLHVVGHALPAALFAIAWLWGTGPSVGLVALAGAAAVAGGVMWKFAVITRACHQQGFAVPKMPQRGSGTRAAPARLNPI
jgi:phenylacetyl-CoA:acceptor oxidoreductase 26-kDa subunit